ncbi:MAG: hypothetical protein QOJ49_11 [Actinomycetota bacterium]|nr:hypothetical protein [Actinomycetota bacterium]
MSESSHERHRRTEQLRRAVDEAAKADNDRRTQQRNAAVAIAVLAIVVVALLVAVVSGATDVLRP